MVQAILEKAKTIRKALPGSIAYIGVQLRLGSGKWCEIRLREGSRVRDLVDQIALPEGLTLDRVIVNDDYAHADRLWRSRRRLLEGDRIFLTAMYPVAITNYDKTRIVLRRNFPVLGLPLAELDCAVEIASGIQMTGEVMVDGQNPSLRQRAKESVSQGHDYAVVDP